MRTVRILLALVVVATLALFGLIGSGTYPIGADAPHSRVAAWMLETLRERSIRRASADIVVPPLEDPAMIAEGGAEYEEMCVACHLKPGMENSELRQGLYPQPPDLAQAVVTAGDEKTRAAEHFWTIKHGVKASAMPAWGLTHEDAVIWSIVAFLQKLPSLTAEQYEATVAGESSHHHDHGSSHPAPVATAPVASAIAGTEPVAVVEQFQHLLSSGDTEAASALLDPKVRIFEGGGVEQSRDEYASHHLGADAEFLGKATVVLMSRTGDVAGDLAWVGSQSRISAISGASPVDLLSTETLVLRKGEVAWRIVHIHWSSRPVVAADAD